MINVAGNAIGHPQSYLGKENYENVPGKFTYNTVQDLAGYYGSDTFLHNEGLNQYGRGGEKHTQNLPLKAGKGSVCEGGIREPMIVQWKGKIEAGTRSDHPVIIEDFFSKYFRTRRNS